MAKLPDKIEVRFVAGDMSADDMVELDRALKRAIEPIGYECIAHGYRFETEVRDIEFRRT